MGFDWIDFFFLFNICWEVKWGLLDFCLFCLYSYYCAPISSLYGFVHLAFQKQDPLFSCCLLSSLVAHLPVVLISYFCTDHLDYDEFGRDEFSFGNRPAPNGVDRDGPVLSKLGSSSTAELHPKSGAQGESKPTSMPPASVMTRLILIMVWRKLIRNPNTYSSLIGLTWSLVSFK